MKNQISEHPEERKKEESLLNMFNPELALSGEGASAPGIADRTLSSDNGKNIATLLTQDELSAVPKETAVSRIIKRIKKKKTGEEKPPPKQDNFSFTQKRDKLYT